MTNQNANSLSNIIYQKAVVNVNDRSDYQGYLCFCFFKAFNETVIIAYSCHCCDNSCIFLAFIKFSIINHMKFLVKFLVTVYLEHYFIGFEQKPLPLPL